MQSPDGEVPETTKETLVDPDVTIFQLAAIDRPTSRRLCIHGPGWGFGNDHTHDQISGTRLEDGARQTMDTDADRLPDEVLLAGLGTGDVDFTVTFVHRFQRVVFGVAMTVTGDPGTAEDVAQQTFERAGGTLRCTTRGAGRSGRG